MSPLIEKLLAQRRAWVEVEQGVKVRVLRPAEADMPRVMAAAVIDAATECVDAWEGVTEATLLGPAVGGTSPVPFDAQLWRAVVADRTLWLDPIVTHLREAIAAHLQAKADAAKN